VEPAQPDQQPAHEQRLELGEVRIGQGFDGPISLDPRVTSYVEIGALEVEGQKCRQIVEEPAKAAVVEVDDDRLAVVDEHVVRHEVGVDQPESVRRTPQAGETRPGLRPGAVEQVPLGRREYREIGIPAPQGARPQHSVLVPPVSHEPWRR
jgi:hypothetical protein